MFGPCPVVRIKHDNPEGFCEINESDFDAANHELVKEQDDSKKPAAKSRNAKAE